MNNLYGGGLGGGAGGSASGGMSNSALQQQLGQMNGAGPLPSTGCHARWHTIRQVPMWVLAVLVVVVLLLQ